MTARSFAESVFEQATLAWLESLGWRVTHGLEIAPGEAGAAHSDPNYRDVVLASRPCQALVRINSEGS